MRFEITGFLPQETRKKLFELVYEVYEARARDPERRSGRGRPPTNKAIAEALGVSIGTIKAWKAGEFQGNDRNALRLLEKALELNPRKTLKILEEDVGRHLALYYKIVTSIEGRDGAPDYVIPVGIPKELRSELDEVATRGNKTVGSIVREAINEYLESQRAGKKMPSLWLRILNLLEAEGPLTEHQIIQKLQAHKTEVHRELTKLMKTNLVRRAWIKEGPRGWLSDKLRILLVEGRRPDPIYYLPSQRNKVAQILIKMLKKPKTENEKNVMMELIKNSELDSFLEKYLTFWAEGKFSEWGRMAWSKKEEAGERIEKPEILPLEGFGMT